MNIDISNIDLSISQYSFNAYGPIPENEKKSKPSKLTLVLENTNDYSDIFVANRNSNADDIFNNNYEDITIDFFKNFKYKYKKIRTLGEYLSGRKEITYYSPPDKYKEIVKIHERFHSIHHLTLDPNTSSIWMDFDKVPSFYKELLAQLFTYIYIKDLNKGLLDDFLALCKEQSLIYNSWIIFRDYNFDKAEDLYWEIRRRIINNQPLGLLEALNTKINNNIMSKSNFTKLNPNNSLFKELSQNPPAWWKNLLSDPKTYIEIRKGNKIDVYYNGGAIITSLQHSKGKYSGKINMEYLPLNAEKGDYLKYDFDNNSAKIINAPNIYNDFQNFDNKILEKIKEKISHHYPNYSEKGIQASFILNDGNFIDSEFAYDYNNKTIRIDLVRVDVNKQKIVFYELKRMGDARLYETNMTKHNIESQLLSYHQFIVAYKNELLDYYKDIFIIKKNLGLLPKNLKNLNDLNGYTILEKPFLLFGDCEQSWINNDSSYINNRIKNIAYGCYYFGKPDYNCDIVSKSSRNKYIF
ncbi:MAG: hypothetical protein ACOYN6_00335 [Ignavibacteria bacterium]